MNQPSCKTFRNANGDESLFVPPGIDVAAIPEPFQSLVDERYRECLTDPASYIAKLADSVKLDSLQRWLRAMCDDGRFGLTVHRAEFSGRVQAEVTICGVVGKVKRQRNFRLPTGGGADLLPYPLSEVYRATDGILESHDALLTSQFVRSRDLDFNAGSFDLVDDESPFELADTLAFYRTDTGDYLLAEGRRRKAEGSKVFSFCHEDGAFCEIGSLLEVIDSYFESDLNNRRWNAIDRS